LSTIVWLLFRRLLYGPIRYFAYLPTKWLLQLLTYILSATIGTFLSLVSSTSKNNTISNPSQVPMASPPNMPQIHLRGGPNKFQGTLSPVNQAIARAAREAEAKKQKDASLSDEVGKMAEDSRKDGESGKAGETVLEGHGDDTNPKKRMWEEPVEGKSKDKDEL
jgi:protein transport protein SEC20